VNVAIVGCGVRGSLVAALLASSGVEELSLIDGAFVEDSDIGSHPFQFTPDLLANKSEALTGKLGLINPKVLAQPFPAFVTDQNASAILTGADCVVDCANDAEASPLIAAAAAELNIEVISPPTDYDPEAVNVATAGAVGAAQGERVLELRDAKI